MSDILDEKYNGLSMADMAKMANLSQSERAAILAKAGQTAAANPQGAGGRPDAGGLSSAVFDIMKQIEEQAGKKSDEYWGKDEHGILATLKKVGRVGQELGGAVLKGGPIFGPLMYEGKAAREKQKLTEEFKALAPTVDRDILGQQADATRNANAQLAAKAKAEAEAQKFQIEQAKLMQNAPRVAAQSEKFQAETKRINAEVASGAIDAAAGLAKFKLAYAETTGQLPGVTTSDQMNAAAMNGVKPQEMTGAQMGAGVQAQAAAKAIPALLARQAGGGGGTTRLTERETPQGIFYTKSTLNKGGSPAEQQKVIQALTGMAQMGQPQQAPPQGMAQQPMQPQTQAPLAPQPRPPAPKPIATPSNVNPLVSAPQPEGREYGKDMNEGAVKAFQEVVDGMKMIKELKSDIRSVGSKVMKPGGSLRYENPLGSMYSQFIGDKEGVLLANKIEIIRQTLGKAKEGGVLRKEDELKYKKMLPNMDDLPDIAQGKLQNFYKDFSSTLKTHLATQKASGRKTRDMEKYLESALKELEADDAGTDIVKAANKPKIKFIGMK